PLSRAHVVRHSRLELNLYALGITRMHAQRVRKRWVGKLLDWCEVLFEQRELLNAFNRERPDLAVLGNVREQIETALCIRQTIRMNLVRLGPVARFRMICDARLTQMQCRLE